SAPRVTLLFVRRGRAPGSTLFPYTTLFRSRESWTFFMFSCICCAWRIRPASCPFIMMRVPWRRGISDKPAAAARPLTPVDELRRSEEHTSELQSRENLVCRLLLEKKNIVAV